MTIPVWMQKVNAQMERKVRGEPVHFDRGDGKAACGKSGTMSRTLSDDACPACLDVLEHEYQESSHT